MEKLKPLALAVDYKLEKAVKISAHNSYSNAVKGGGEAGTIAARAGSTVPIYFSVPMDTGSESEVGDQLLGTVSFGNNEPATKAGGSDRKARGGYVACFNVSAPKFDMAEKEKKAREDKEKEQEKKADKRSDADKLKERLWSAKLEHLKELAKPETKEEHAKLLAELAQEDTGGKLHVVMGAAISGCEQIKPEKEVPLL